MSRLVTALAVAASAVTLMSAPAPALAEGTSATVGGAALASPGLVVDAPGATPLPRLSAASFLVADLEAGDVLAARDPHGRFRPASTLKVLTAVTLLPRLTPDTVYRARWEDANVEGSRVGVVPGATYPVRSLFQGLLLVSGNDAAAALANASGGVAPTVARMQQQARAIGALDTTVRNPSGLDAPGQFSSAYDLALFARAGLARSDFRGYVSTVRTQFPGKMPRAGRHRKAYEIYTQDRLLLNYPGAIGVKTGWTTKARGTFVGAATRGGRTLVATVMRSKVDSWEEARSLLDWGFRNAARARPVGTLVRPEPPAQASVARHVVRPGGAAAAAPPTGVAAVPRWAWVPILLVASVVTLRARVLVRRRVRRSTRRLLPARRP